MRLVGWLHGNVHERRARILSERFAQLMPAEASVLDVGAGDGMLARLIADQRPDVHLEGIDVHARPTSYIPVRKFDGTRIPHDDGSVDVVLFVDVLHHTDDPMILLREACRVAREAILIKDHTCNGVLAHPTLRFMDWVGNARHGVALPYNYWTRQRWVAAFEQLGLEVDEWAVNLALYPPPANWIFGRRLHFLARLRPPEAGLEP